MGCRRVELKTDARNERSRGAMEAFGATFEVSTGSTCSSGAARTATPRGTASRTTTGRGFATASGSAWPPTSLDPPGGRLEYWPDDGGPPANPVSITAYWTLAARYADATGPRPVANDTYAERFMDDDARAVAERFSALKRPFQSFLIRHRVIDDMLREGVGRVRG